MTDPRKAIQDAIYDVLTTAGLTALVDPAETDAVPYTVFGGGTMINGPLETKTTDGAEVTHTLVSWAEDVHTAQANASTGLDAITDRDAGLSVTGYSLVMCRHDFSGDLLRDTTEPDKILYGVPYRVRIVVQHP